MEDQQKEIKDFEEKKKKEAVRILEFLKQKYPMYYNVLIKEFQKSDY